MKGIWQSICYRLYLATKKVHKNSVFSLECFILCHSKKLCTSKIGYCNCSVHTQWTQKRASCLLVDPLVKRTDDLSLLLFELSLILFPSFLTVYNVYSICRNSWKKVSLERKWINLLQVFPSHYKFCPHCVTRVTPIAIHVCQISHLDIQVSVHVW